jgi:hypothetical protein
MVLLPLLLLLNRQLLWPLMLTPARPTTTTIRGEALTNQEESLAEQHLLSLISDHCLSFV